jgi:hypothetical protein
MCAQRLPSKESLERQKAEIEAKLQASKGAQLNKKTWNFKCSKCHAVDQHKQQKCQNDACIDVDTCPHPDPYSVHKLEAKSRKIEAQLLQRSQIDQDKQVLVQQFASTNTQLALKFVQPDFVSYFQTATAKKASKHKVPEDPAVREELERRGCVNQFYSCSTHSRNAFCDKFSFKSGITGVENFHPVRSLIRDQQKDREAAIRAAGSNKGKVYFLDSSVLLTSNVYRDLGSAN